MREKNQIISKIKENPQISAQEIISKLLEESAKKMSIETIWEIFEI